MCSTTCHNQLGAMAQSGTFREHGLTTEPWCYSQDAEEPAVDGREDSNASRLLS